MKLVQKHLFKGTREFEIEGDEVRVHMKSWFKEEKLTVMLAVLNPKPEINGGFLDFHSRVKCSALMSLFRNKPNKAEYDEFVSYLSRRATEEYDKFAGMTNVSQEQQQDLHGNVYDEPPEFAERDQNQPGNHGLKIDMESIESSIDMLEQYLDSDGIKPLLAALKDLKDEPENQAKLTQVIVLFNDLGPEQGAVLTYAPYLNILMSDDPFAR